MNKIAYISLTIKKNIVKLRLKCYSAITKLQIAKKNLKHNIIITYNLDINAYVICFL